jgi:hypothetical protein
MQLRCQQMDLTGTGQTPMRLGTEPGPAITPGRVDMADMHLEVNAIPVSDIERSKKFYDRLVWRLGRG